jgi:mannitol-1-phosphate 5-dehydrogenase
MPDASDYLESRIGVVEALIRVGATDPPEDERAEEPALVWTGGPGVLHVDEDAFKGPIPDVPGLVLVHDPARQSMIKIWLGNMAHGYLAYRGYVQGHEYIHECANDPIVTADVEAAMKESAAALVADGRMTESEAAERVSEFPRRANNPEYRDTVRRVAADPRRKLSRDNRFVGPLLLARRYGLPFQNLARAAACALHFALPQDEEAMWIQQRIREVGLRPTTFQVCGLHADEGDVVDAIMAEYKSLQPKQ